MRRAAAIVAALALLALPGCGGDRPDLVVAAASSLRNGLAVYGIGFDPADVRLSFGGSDELAAQIRAGAPVDVFAAANSALPDRLHADGEVEKPVRFTANELVLAVPANDTKVTTLDDLARPGIDIALGSETVPIGSYTRRVLAGLPAAQRRAILANVRSEEPDVAGIVGKLTQGAVDAGFVYATDVAATRDSLDSIPLPERLQPTVVYEAAVVKGSEHRAEARAFVRGLRGPAGQRALRDAGFLPLPRR